MVNVRPCFRSDLIHNSRFFALGIFFEDTCLPQTQYNYFFVNFDLFLKAQCWTRKTKTLSAIH